MAVNVKSLSPLGLKGLRQGNTIIIRYARSQQEVDKNASRIIHERFPKNVATAFSSEWAKLFPAINNMTVAQMSSQPACKAVTIIGGSVDDALNILQWMLSCCEGRGFQEFPFPTKRPFSTYFMIKKTADIMGITVLSNELMVRMNNIAARQVHSDDIRAMYQLLPADDPILHDIAARIAVLIRLHQLKAFAAYDAVRHDIPAFDHAIEAVLGPRKSKDQKKKEAAGGMIRRATYPKTNSKPKPKPGAFENRPVQHQRRPLAPQQHQYRGKPALLPPKSKSENASTSISAQVEPQIQHKTLHCPVRRKAIAGRPEYYVLPLANIGVTKHDFAGTRSPGPGAGWQGGSRRSRRQDKHVETRATSSLGDDIKQLGDGVKDALDNGISA